MRRALVLGDDAARHPFRQQLPRHIRRGEAPQPMRQRVMPSRRYRLAAAARIAAAETGGWVKRHAYAGRAAARGLRGGTKVTGLDLREFLLAYCACFIAAIAFLS